MTKIVLSSGASLLALLLVACGLVACGANSEAPSDAGPTVTQDATTGGPSTPLPCDVTAVLQSHCQSCHGATPTSGAPMPLVTWEDLNAPVIADSDGTPATPGELVYEMVETRIHDVNNPMPPKPYLTLDAEDLATLDNWIAAGAPKTDSATCTGVSDDGGPGIDAAPPTLTCDQNSIVLSPASPFTMPGGGVTDQYECYSFTAADLDAGAVNHILGITPHIGNKLIVHHVLLMESDPPDTSVTSTPSPCSAELTVGWNIIYGWAPGGGPMITPPNVGFPYTSTTQFIVQVHYNDVSGDNAGQMDTSGFSFCTTDQPVKYDADVMAFGSMTGFSIPPNGSLDWICPLTLGSAYEGLNVFAAFPHMHKLGVAIETEQTLAGGGIVDMGRNDPFSFNSQIWFPVSATLHQGDVVTTRCAWTDPPPNSGSPVGFGYTTEDEMCYSFTAYYPKAALATWAQPALGTASTCYASDGGVLPTPDGGWVPQDSGAVFPIEDGGAPEDGGGD